MRQGVTEPVGQHRDGDDGADAEPGQGTSVAAGDAEGDRGHGAEEGGEAGGVGKLRVIVPRQDEFGRDVDDAEHVSEREVGCDLVGPVGHANQEERQRKQRGNEKVDGEDEARSGHALQIASLMMERQ